MTEAATRPTPGTPCWVSLMVHDLAASQAFYHELFGWEFRDGPDQLGPYVRAVQDGHAVAGLGQMASGLRRPVAWLPYIATDDADVTTALVRDCGGTLAVGPLDAQQVGRLAIAADLSGAAFGVWQPGTHHGVPYRELAGSPVWTKLVTSDATPAGKFYSMVFGYEALPEPELPSSTDYLALRLHGIPIGGIEGVGAAVPHDRGPHWLTYFSAPDVDGTAERLVELGGRLLTEPADSPFGRFAEVADPEGAPFALIRPVQHG